MKFVISQILQIYKSKNCYTSDDNDTLHLQKHQKSVGGPHRYTYENKRTKMKTSACCAVSFVLAVTQTMLSIQISLQARDLMKDTLDCHFLRLCKYAALARSCDPDLSHLGPRAAQMNCR